MKRLILTLFVKLILITNIIAQCQITLTSATGSDAQSVCENSSINAITYSISAANAEAIGLPAGISADFTNNVMTINGTLTPNALPGLYTYTINTSGGCNESVTGTIQVGLSTNQNSGSLNQAICINQPIQTIILNVGGSITPSIMWSGPNGAVAPTGVTSSTATASTYTIGGTPTQDGTYTYTVTTNGCAPQSILTGTITVGIGQPINSGALSQIVCENSALAPITIDYAGAAPSINWQGQNGVIPPIGIISGTATASKYTIGGTPTQDGTYTYTVTTNGCAPQSKLTGTITVGIGQPINSGALSQIVCNGDALDGIIIDFAGTSAPVILWQGPLGNNPLTGVSSGQATASTYTIGGTTFQNGTYTYTVSTNGCSPQSQLTGTITVGIGQPINSGALSQEVCNNEPLALITIDFATSTPTINWQGPNGTAAPTGVTMGQATANTYTIGGTPIQDGTYTYTVSTIGCSLQSQLTGTITVGIGVADNSGASSQSLCSNTALAPIKFNIAGGGASITWESVGPVGVISGYSSSTYTIVGIPSLEGTYSYTINTTGCIPESAFTGTIEVFPTPASSIFGTASVCRNEQAPLITFTGSAGTPPFTFNYTINDVNETNITTTANTITIEAPTTTVGEFIYSLKRVTDANSCSEMQAGDVTINVLDDAFCNSSFTLRVNTTDASSSSNCDGTATVEVRGGQQPYAIDLPHTTINDSTFLVSSLCAGYYTVMATDDLGNSSSFTFVVGSPETTYTNTPVDGTPTNTLVTDAIQNCVIDYNTVSSVFISSVELVNNNKVLVTWSVVQGTVTTTQSAEYEYSIMGLYTFILDVYCTSRSGGSSLKAIDYYDLSSLTSSVNTVSNNSEVQVYPNPVNETLYIQTTQVSSISISNIAGVTVYSGELSIGKNTINTAALAPGLYIVSIKNEDGVVTQKVVK